MSILEPWGEMEVGETSYFKTRAARGGQWVPVSLWIKDGDRDERGELMSDQIYGATINGEDNLIPAYIYDQAMYWTPILKPEHDHLVELSKWRSDNGVKDSHKGKLKLQEEVPEPKEKSNFFSNKVAL